MFLLVCLVLAVKQLENQGGRRGGCCRGLRSSYALFQRDLTSCCSSALLEGG
jgi:hypothetical protein